MNDLETIYTDDFERIRQIIEQVKQEAESKVNETIINLYWNIGKFVSEKAQKDGWGRSTIRGYSSQNIWRMKQFYETYRDKPELSTLLRANTWSRLRQMKKKCSI